MKAELLVRNTLRFNPDGLTLNEIAQVSGVPYRSVHRAVAKMPDVYIDRWRAPTGAYPYQAVWCSVPVPDNCPHPKETT
jgi:hypothetical protein